MILNYTPLHFFIHTTRKMLPRIANYPARRIVLCIASRLRFNTIEHLILIRGCPKNPSRRHCDYEERSRKQSEIRLYFARAGFVARHSLQTNVIKLRKNRLPSLLCAAVVLCMRVRRGAPACAPLPAIGRPHRVAPTRARLRFS
jgi:hypothetical protein